MASPICWSDNGTDMTVAGYSTCQIQNKSATPTYVGPQGTIPGLDQLKLLLPQLADIGETDVVCSFSVNNPTLRESTSALPVKINIK